VIIALSIVAGAGFSVAWLWVASHFGPAIVAGLVMTVIGLFGQAAALVVALKVDINPKHGDVDKVSILDVVPLFRRDADGKARIFGFRAKRLDRT
jgi:hypothetical protein